MRFANRMRDSELAIKPNDGSSIRPLTATGVTVASPTLIPRNFILAAAGLAVGSPVEGTPPGSVN